MKPNYIIVFDDKEGIGFIPTNEEARIICSFYMSLAGVFWFPTDWCIYDPYQNAGFPERP